MKKYHIITIGCQMNKSDSERIAIRLEKVGYKRSDNKYQADLVVVNTCGVRQTAEDRLYGLIPEIKKANPKCFVIITGCLIYRKDIKKRLDKFVDGWMMITEITNDKFQMTNKCQMSNVKCQNDYLNIQPRYESKFSAFVPIGNGCNNFCSYCVVPYARGREVYRSAEDILKEVKSLVKKNYKEIILIAQNVNSYNSRIKRELKANYRKSNIDFADLLKKVNNIQGDFWIRFLTSHPKDMSDRLIKTIASCEKVCQHIHLPVQAGDDEILKKMNRKYTVANYVELTKKIRKGLKYKIQNTKYKLWQPLVAITTDIIVGFPCETKKQFNNTVKLFKQIKFDMAYISRYSPRPGTVAFKLEDNVSKEEKKNRENKLLRILRQTALVNNKKYINKIVRVLIENKNKTGEWFGKTATGKIVKIKISNDKKELVGEFVEVKIIGVKKSCLVGNY
ncbi:MAG: tRNA (N6-isopentenyl adenosine(37)-C2)-methylthiotransferase MiaB [Patescibacteria group bacterium]